MSKVARVVLLFAAVCMMAGCANLRLDDGRDGFVSLAEAVPDAILEIRYYSTYNFVGERIDGYEQPCAMLTKEAAAALKSASDDAVRRGYRLKIYDAYRPQRAVAHFMRWARDAGDTRMKYCFYPNLVKSELFERGYIAEKSGHSRGSTVDLTLFDMKTGREVDMGGTFDWFGEESHPDYKGVTEKQYANRKLLREIMTSHGFKPLEEEWWHFTLANEPYPDTYFDFPVGGYAAAPAGVPDAEYATEQDLPRLEALMFDVSGSKIYGQILVPSPKAGRGRPCAIICHGIAGFTRWDDVAHDLCRAGIAVVIPHHRGAWGSDGEYLVSGCITDAEELAKFAMGSEFAQSHGTDTNKVYLIGHSMGGNSVLNAASRLPGVRGVALIAPCEIGYMAQTMPRDGVMAFMVEQGMGVLRRRSDDAVVDDVLSHADGMRFTNAARNIAGKKVFLATGDYDDVVPSAPLDEFWASLPSDGELHWRKSYKASHAFMGVRREIASDLTRFIYARLQLQTLLAPKAL